MFLLAVGVMCLTACAQKKGGERGPHMGGGMSVNKDSDSTFVALKNDAHRHRVLVIGPVQVETLNI